MKRKIQIGRRTYKIERVNTIRRNKKDLSKTTIGIINPRKKLIRVKHMGKIIDNKTLFHEIAHGLMVEMVFSAGRGCQKAKMMKNKKQFIKFQNNFCKLNCDENFIEYFGGLLNTTFKLK